MKCPKCAYVGFEAADRCRHCGYDFSLVADPLEAAPPRVEPVTFPVPARERAPLAAVASEPPPIDDLPLQVAEAESPGVVVDLFAELPRARTPLAVRRATERPRSRATPHVSRRTRPVLLEPVAAPPEPAATRETGAETGSPAAPTLARLVSAAVDLAILSALDAVVVYLTAQIAGVPTAEVLELPLAPLATFVFGLNIAYLAAFTANGGQTLGKMAAGLRVEGAEGPVTFGAALLRVAVAIAGGLAAGAGFLPALWRADGRAVHDQIAGTRVVRVTP